MNHFKSEMFVGFLLGAVFTIFSEIVIGVPARVPVYTDYSVPIHVPQLHFATHSHGT